MGMLSLTTSLQAIIKVSKMITKVNFLLFLMYSLSAFVFAGVCDYNAFMNCTRESSSQRQPECSIAKKMLDCGSYAEGCNSKHFTIVLNRIRSYHTRFCSAGRSARSLRSTEIRQRTSDN